MAFKSQAEFWTMTDASMAMGAPLLDRVIADAIEIDADTEEPIALPVADNRAATSWRSLRSTVTPPCS